ncbi:MAG: chitobiase/beta-hexosaminidase C-terminal domain-containing protein [Saprospiraceae bacterium]|nr:chitobiase/beta-hexosaminidase C-terminal domain-containing protein [Saprospiraceae bacterium]
MMMQRITGIISNANFGLAILAAILLVFDSFVGVPEYLKLAGRLHPLMLHLPIGMFVMYLVLFFLKKGFEAPDFEKLLNFVLLLTGFFAFITAISGSLLSHEPDAYNVNELAFHRNTGFGFAFGLYLLSIVNGKYPTFSNILLGINTLLLIVAGHKGAEITHGKDFLFPNKDVKEILSDTNTTLFTAMVHPILEKKCYSCHNEEKTKGGLIMTDSLSLLKGGESGRVLRPGNADSSLMVESMLLPLEDEKHMPPDGKPQVTAQEKEIIIAWINSGASFSKKASAYKPDESIRKLYDANVGAKKQKQYTFSSADSETLASLNSHFMSVKPLFGGSPALKASLFLASEYVPEHLKQLLQIKQQLIHLHLADMPVTDRDIGTLAQFSSLEKLILNGTKVTDQGILKLSKLSKLEQLSLANTSITEAIEPIFSQLPSLRQIFITDTKIPENKVRLWQQKYPAITFNKLSMEDLKIKLSSPLMVNESYIIKPGEEIVLKHYINGAQIKYTLDGSEPDSLHGTLYSKPFTISGSIDVKTVAVKDGWFVSDVVKFSLFENGATPDSCILLTQPNVQYKGEGALTFINGKRAPINNLPDANWIAFRENLFSAIFEYKMPIALTKISFCYGLQVPQYVFPPTAVSVFGSNDKKQFQLLTNQKIAPYQKNNKDQVKSDVIHLSLKSQPFKYYKIEAQNLQRIPDWHPGKGERGWLFIDEIFFYE